MRKLSVYTNLFLLVILCYTLSSCSVAQKRKETRLIGAWNVVNVIDKNSEITSQWIFREDGTVVINEFTDTATVIVDEGIWTLEQKATKALLNTAFGTVLSEQLGISVEWDIHYLKKNTMYLTHQDGGILTKEFERAK